MRLHRNSRNNGRKCCRTTRIYRLLSVVRGLWSLHAPANKSRNPFSASGKFSDWRQIVIQLQGITAFNQPEIADALKLTEPQRQTMREIEVETFIMLSEMLSERSNLSDEQTRRYNRQGLMRSAMDKCLAAITPAQLVIWKKNDRRSIPRSFVGCFTGCTATAINHFVGSFLAESRDGDPSFVLHLRLQFSQFDPICVNHSTRHPIPPQRGYFFASCVMDR